MTKRIEVGLLFSRSGTYALISESCRAGALKAIQRVNAQAGGRIEIVPVERDPGGNVDRYAPLAEDILRDTGARHIIGCITSWSRKEVIPALEKHGGMLWYPAPYEGFEASENVVYMHACPNQHILPLLAYVVPRFGSRAFLVGSNYIWGWETNRIARDLIGDAGGTVLGERYLALGDEDVDRIVEDIRVQRPNFILNNFVGATSYAFLRAYAELGRRDPWFQPKTCPLISCNMSEAELPAIGENGEGHLSVGPYFDGLPGKTDEGLVSSFMASAYSAVMILAEMLADGSAAGGYMDFAGRQFSTPLGRIAIDPATRHTHLPVRIARIHHGRFEVVEEPAACLAPDPYLSRYDPLTALGRAGLRVVS
jgi:ABC-type branched-subunit amino acid transport system substrate-binding protein